MQTLGTVSAAVKCAVWNSTVTKLSDMPGTPLEADLVQKGLLRYSPRLGYDATRVPAKAVPTQADAAFTQMPGGK